MKRVFGLAGLLAACSPAAPAKMETTPAVAEPPAAVVVDTLFTHGGCYAVYFDDAQIAAHPQRTITGFLISNPGEDVRNLDTDSDRHIGFAFQLKGDPDIYTGLAACGRTPGSASCTIEGDGGDFAIAPTEAGGLRVIIGRMEVEGPSRFTPNLGEVAENRTLDLPQATGTDCMVD